MLTWPRALPLLKSKPDLVTKRQPWFRQEDPLGGVGVVRLCTAGQRGPMLVLDFSFWYYNAKLLSGMSARLAGLWGFKKCVYFYSLAERLPELRLPV